MGLLSTILLEDTGIISIVGNLAEVFGGITRSVIGLRSELTEGLDTKGIFDSAQQTQEALSQMDVVLKSTGDASGMTKKQLMELAESEGRITAFSQNTNMATENLLLTFTNIGKDVFPQALKSVNDMSQALGQDTKTSALELGKALNNPIKGVSDLESAGVKFTESQEDQIKAMQQAGNIAGAQNIILKQLEKQYGGSAEAASNTFSAQLKILKNNLISVNSEMLNGMMKTLTNFLKQVNSFVLSIGKLTPATQKAAGAFATIAVGIMPTLSAMNKFIDLAGKNKAAMEKLIKSYKEGTTAIQKFGNSSGVKKLQSAIQTLQIRTLYAMDGINNGMKKGTSAISKSMSGLFNKLPDGLTQNMKKVNSSLKSGISSIAGGMGKITSTVGKYSGKFTSQIGAMGKKVTPVFTSLGKKMTSSLSGIVKLGLKAVGPAALLAVVLVGLGVLQMQSGKKLDSIAKQLIAKGPTMIQQFAAKLVAQLPQIMAAGTTLLNNFIKVLIANAPALIRAATSIITALVNGLAVNLPKLLPEIVKLIQVILQSIIQNLPTIIMAGLKIILALVQGISNNLPQIINAIIQVTITLINTIAQHLPQIIEMGLKILGAIIQGIVKAIPLLIAAIPQIVTAIWNALKSVNWLQLGSEIVNGIISGIISSGGQLFKSLENLAGKALNVAKNILGIHSPSRVFKEEVGLFIPAGVAEGVEENTGGVVNSLNGMASKMVNSIGKNKSNIVDAAKGLGNINFATMGTMNLAAASGVVNSPSNNGSKYNALLHVENLSIANDYDIEALANKLNFYMQKSKAAKGGR